MASESLTSVGEGAGGLAAATVRGLADDALLPGCAPARAALEGRCSVAGAKSRDAVGRPRDAAMARKSDR